MIKRSGQPIETGVRARLTIDSNRIKRSLAVGILSGQLNGLMVVTFGASLGGEGKGDCITVGLAKNEIDLIDGVGSIFELSNVEAFLFLDVSTFDLGDDNVFGDANLFWDWDGNINGHFQWDGDQRNAISLGLVFSSAVLVFSGTIVITVARWAAGGDLHGFGFLLVSHLKKVQNCNA